MMNLDRTISVAPMMGYTDRHCRVLLRLLAPHSLLYTEMVTTGALIHGDTQRFLAHHADEPCALQLGGSDPQALAASARLGEQAGYQEINLNVGCPSDRVQQGRIGACLMAEPALVGECVAAMQQAVKIPVTVKSRIGIDDQDSYELFAKFVETVSESGCETFIVHARKAILSGLSPKENREIPPLNYDFVRRIQTDRPDLEFILNGGIRDRASAVSLLEEFQGVMLGRAPYSDPWLMAELEQAVYGTPLPDRMDILFAYREYMLAELAKGEPLKAMAKHLLGYFTGIRGARAFRRALSTNMFRENVGIALLDRALDAVETDIITPTQQTGT